MCKECGCRPTPPRLPEGWKYGDPIPAEMSNQLTERLNKLAWNSFLSMDGGNIKQDHATGEPEIRNMVDVVERIEALRGALARQSETEPGRIP